MEKSSKFSDDKKTKFSVIKLQYGEKIACKSRLFTPKEIIVKPTHLLVHLQHGGFNDKEPAPLYWHKYELNGQFSLCRKSLTNYKRSRCTAPFF